MIRDDGPCCALPIRHWAMASSTATGIYFVLLTVLAGLAKHQVGAQEVVTTAEGNKAEIWSNPKRVSLSLAVIFPAFAIISFALSFLLASNTSRPAMLKGVGIGAVIWAVVMLAWCVCGAWMSFNGSVSSEIEEACATIDKECYAEYTALKWVSIVMEVIGFMAIVWMLTTVYHYRSELGGSSASGASEKLSRSRYPDQHDEEAAPLRNLAAPLPSSSNSLGRTRHEHDYVRHSRRASSSSAKSAPRRDRRASEHSISKRLRSASRGRYNDGESSGSDDGGRGRAKGFSSRGRRASRARDRLKGYEREAEEWAMRSMARGRSRSSRRSSHHEERSMGTSRSRSRRRRDSISSEDGYREPRRSMSRSRSRSRR